MSVIPNMGNSTKGIKAVAATGKASLAHHIAIRMAIAAVRHANGSSSLGVGANSTAIAATGPNMNPIC